MRNARYSLAPQPVCLFVLGHIGIYLKLFSDFRVYRMEASHLLIINRPSRSFHTFKSYRMKPFSFQGPLNSFHKKIFLWTSFIVHKNRACSIYLIRYLGPKPLFFKAAAGTLLMQGISRNPPVVAISTDAGSDRREGRKRERERERESRVLSFVFLASLKTE